MAKMRKSGIEGFGRCGQPDCGAGDSAADTPWCIRIRTRLWCKTPPTLSKLKG